MIILDIPITWPKFITKWPFFSKNMDVWVSLFQFLFYTMIYISDFGKIPLGSKKSMKELDYPPNFWSKVYWHFLDSQKKFWGLGAPSPYLYWDPQNALNKAFGGSHPHRGWGPQTPNFFWEVQSAPIDFAPKIRWVVQLLHGFFWAKVILPKSLL